jgi:hypothetical protein
MQEDTSAPARASKQKTIAVRPEVYARIKRLATAEHRTVAGTIEHTLAEYEAQR